MRIDLLCVGSVKESFFREAIAEYSKRLSRYVKLNIFEVKDEKTPDNASEKEKIQIMKTEANRLEKYIAQDAYLVALAIEGKEMASEKFANHLLFGFIRNANFIVSIITKIHMRYCCADDMSRKIKIT